MKNMVNYKQWEVKDFQIMVRLAEKAGEKGNKKEIEIFIGDLNPIKAKMLHHYFEAVEKHTRTFDWYNHFYSNEHYYWNKYYWKKKETPRVMGRKGRKYILFVGITNHCEVYWGIKKINLPKVSLVKV
jgi:hypothetical protein